MRVTQRAQKPVILMYHRIAERDIDPWGLAVSPDRFEEQLQVLKAVREPLLMTEFIVRLEKGNLPANAVGVTFDDGYGDNFRVAKPLLDRVMVPATIFLTTGTIGTEREFWWDELARLILGHSGSCDCEIAVADSRFRLTLPKAPPEISAFKRWGNWQKPRTEREFAYVALWKRLRPLSHVEREAAISNLRGFLSATPPSRADFPLTVEEVGELAAANLIEIGAHSVTHPVVSALDLEGMWQEIKVSKDECKRMSAEPVHGFAYPYGAFDDRTKAAVSSAGFRFACSTYADFIDVRRFDLFAMPRLQVKNWGADDFERRLPGVGG